MRAYLCAIAILMVVLGFAGDAEKRPDCCANGGPFPKNYSDGPLFIRSDSKGSDTNAASEIFITLF